MYFVSVLVSACESASCLGWMQGATTVYAMVIRPLVSPVVPDIDDVSSTVTDAASYTVSQMVMLASPIVCSHGLTCFRFSIAFLNEQSQTLRKQSTMLGSHLSDSTGGLLTLRAPAAGEQAAVIDSPAS